MTTVPPSLTHVCDAIVEMLATATTLKVGDGDAPPDADPNKPYVVVIPVPGGYSDGDAGNTDGDFHAVFQITAVGPTRHAAQDGRDLAHSAMLGRATAGGFTQAIDAYHLKTAAATVRSLATHDALKVCDRVHDSSGGVDRDGTVFNAHERYELWITHT